MKWSVNDRKHGCSGLGVNGMIDKFIYEQQFYFLANFSTNDSLGEALLLIIYKETVGNSWDILSAILGHKYHQNHSNRSSE